MNRIASILPRFIGFAPHALLVLFSLLAYGGSLDLWFGSDDHAIFRCVSQGGPLGIWWTDSNFLRPVSSTLWWLSWKAFGLNPSAYHVTNLTLFIATAFLLWHVARRLLARTGRKLDRWSGWLVPVLFVVWPHHTEPVVWPAARTDLVASALAASSILVFLLALDSGCGGTFIAAALLFGLSLLTKESPVALPCFFLALGVIAVQPEHRKSMRRSVFWSLVPFLVTALYLVLRAYRIEGVVGGYGEQHTDFSAPVLFRGLVSHAYACFVPCRLPNGPIADALAPVAASCVATAVLVGLAARWNRAMLSIAVALFIGILASLLPVANMNSWLNGEMERYAYLATFWSVTLVGLALGAVVGPRWTALVGMAIGVVGFPFVRDTLAPWRLVSDEMRREYEALRPVARTGELTVVCVDNILEGAIKWTNGLPDALFLEGIRTLDEVHVLMHLANPMLGDALTASRAGPREVRLLLRYDPHVRRNFDPVMLPDERGQARVAALTRLPKQRRGELEFSLVLQDDPPGPIVLVHRGEVRSLD